MKGARKTCLGAALAVAAFCGSGRASGGTKADAIELDLRGCAGVAYDELRRLLSVELAGRPAFEPLIAAGPRVVVECVNGGRGRIANLSIVDAASGRTTSKPTDLTDVPTAHRPRVLAIAIVELMSEPRAEVAPPPDTRATASVPASAPLPAEDAAPAEKRRPERTTWPWRFDVAGVALHSSGLDPLLWGGQARVIRVLSGWILAAIDVAAMGNSAQVSLGNAEILLVSSSASVLARVHLPPLAWDAGLGYRAGVARFSGSPAASLGSSVQSRIVAGLWGGPLVSTSLAAAPGKHLSLLLLEVEAGYSPARVTAAVDGVTEMAITRWWTSLSVGLGWGE